MSDAPPAEVPAAAIAATSTQQQQDTTSSIITVVAQRLALRTANAAPPLRNQPRDLKSDLKKGTMFAKKIRTYACEHEVSMMTELNTYNLKMFVKETAQGVGAVLFESPKPLRVLDVTSLAVLCSALHQRYDEFIAEVLVHVKKGFDMEPMLAEMTKKLDPLAAHADIHKIRSSVRFMCEWWLIGLVSDAKFIIGVLQRIVMTMESKGATPEAQGHLTVNSLSIVNMILRTVGIEMMGSAQAPMLTVCGHGGNALSWSESEGKIVPVEKATQVSAAEQCKHRQEQHLVQTNAFSTEAERGEFTKRINMVCDNAVQLCTRLKKGVEGKWRQICEQAELRGDPTQEVKEQFQQLRKETERIYVLTENLLTSVNRGQEIPAPLDLTAALQKSNVDTQLTFTSGSAEFFTVRLAETMNYYDDDEQRIFYEDIAPIDHLIPPMEDGGTGIPLTHQQLQKRNGNNSSNSSSDVMVMMDESEASMQGLDGMTKGATALPPDQRKLLDYKQVDALLVALHRCSSVVTAQKWLEDYLEEATKYFYPERLPPDVDPVRPSQARAFFLNCKMMLLVELRYEPDRAQELIPFLARVAAGMHSRFPEFGEALARQLENHIFDAIRNKRPNTFHSKLLNTRYLCELVKFRVCPPIRVIRMTHLAVENFDDEHCALMCAIIVQNAASFLLRGGVTKVKMEEALQKMKQAEKAKGIPSRAETEYEHAWADLRQAMNPNRNRKVFTRVKTPLELYLAQLLYVHLQDTQQSFQETRTRIMQMPWNERGVAAAVPLEEVHAARDTLVRVFRKAHHIGYDRIHLLVRLISEVTKVHGTSCLLQPIVDHLLEDFRRDLETAGAHRTMQKRLQDMKFLAELYNFKLVPLRVITYSIALLLLYKPCGPTHPRDYTRLRCAIQLLRLSAPYFLSKGKPQEKQVTRRLLSLVFCYVHTDVAKPLPMDLDYVLESTLILISKLYDDNMRRSGRRHHQEESSASPSSYFFLATFPRTPAKAMEYAEQVKCESLFEENAYLEESIRGMTSADAQQHMRCFPVLALLSQQSSTTNRVGGATTTSAVAPSSLVGAVLEPTRRTKGPRVRPVESKTVVEEAEVSKVEEALDPSSSDSDDEMDSNSTDSNEEDDDDYSSGSNSEDDDDSSNSSTASSSSSIDDDEEVDSAEEDEENSDDDDDSSDSSESSSGSSESSSSSSDGEEDRPTLGPLAGLRTRGTSNEEDNEFDAMFRDAVKESSHEGARRSANKTSQQQEKIIESRMASINVTSVAKHLHQDMSTTTGEDPATRASMRLLASHQKLKDEELALRKARRSGVSTDAPSAPAQPQEVSAFRVTVLRRAAPAQGASSGASSGASARPLEGKQLLIPMDSEFAQRSQAFVEQSQRDRALVQQQTIMMLRQHEAEEARSAWPTRFRGRGGRGGHRSGGSD